MSATNNKLKMFLKVVLLGACVCVGTQAHAADDLIYTWQAVDGNWDGNITDAAHWTCNKEDKPGYPQTSDAIVDIPAGATATITINEDVTTSNWRVYSGTKLTLVSAESDNAVNKHMKCLTMGQMRTEAAGGTFVFDHARVKSDGDNGITFKFSGTGIVKNGSYITFKKMAILERTSSSVFILEPGTLFETGNIFIGGGNQIIINDAVLKTGGGIYNGERYDCPQGNGVIVFKGAEPKLEFTANDKKVGGNSTKDSILDFNFIIPEGGFKSTPVISKAKQKNQFGTPHGNYGKIRINVLDESPVVASPKKMTHRLIEWDKGFDPNYVIEGNLPQKATEKRFDAGVELPGVYSAIIKGGLRGMKVIIR
jgi:hypothetical protein